jgi:hypothetical protein
MNQSKTTPVVDLSDLFVTKDEAIDLLGDLLGSDPLETSLFGDKPVKITKPRPQWQIDGTVVVTQACKCRTCGTQQTHLNPKLLVAMSYVDHNGIVLKSIQTDDYNLLLEVNGGPFKGKKTAPSAIVVEDYSKETTYKSIQVEDVDFCQDCYAESGFLSLEIIHEVLHNQQVSALRRKESDTSSNKEFRNKLHLERAEAAERKLMELIDSMDKEPEMKPDSFDDELPY